MTTRTEPRPAAAHVPPTPPPPAPAGMALTELLAALEGERRTHAAAVRAGSTRQEATMRDETTTIRGHSPRRAPSPDPNGGEQ